MVVPIGERLKRLQALLAQIEPIPADWVAGRTLAARKQGGTELECLECESWETLRTAWRVALKWTEGLDVTLSVMLATILSTATVGENVWLMVLSPPSTGKSTLCEGLAVNHKHVVMRSELTKLYSGYKMDRGGAEDFSLLEKLGDKTLVVKDLDPLLKSPQRGLVLGQLRDAFDGSAHSHFNNGTSRSYEDKKFTLIACGTSAVYEMDAAEAGARFLVVNIMDHIDDDFEREVTRRVVRRALRNVLQIRDGAVDHREDADETHAKQLTGGYISYLRQHAGDLLNPQRMSCREADAIKLEDYGLFVALMRARPPKKQSEVVEREFSPRLSEQITRLAVCLAAVLGKRCVDADVLRRVRKVVLDTSRGRTLDLVRVFLRNEERALAKAAQQARREQEGLYSASNNGDGDGDGSGEEDGNGDDGGMDSSLNGAAALSGSGLETTLAEGYELSALAFDAHTTTELLVPYLRYLRRIHVVDYYRPTGPRGGRLPARWRLNPRFRALYLRVMEDL